MALPSFARQVLTVARPARIVDHGTTVVDWTDTAQHDVPGCSFQPGASAEVQIRRDASSIAWTVYAPPGADVLATDGALVDGLLYTVIDQPQHWRSATGRLDHLLVLLQRWEG